MARRMARLAGSCSDSDGNMGVIVFPGEKYLRLVSRNLFADNIAAD
jgi:hypothetical protein